MKSYNEDKGEADKEHFIGSIINENGLIKIDVYSLLLDFAGRSIFATRTGTIQDLVNAKNGNVVNSVLHFSMDEHDVIEELQAHKTRGILCKDRWAKRNNDWTNILYTNVMVPGYINATLQANAKYSKSGIYFELQTESYCPQWGNIGGTGIVVPRKLNYVYSWERRCGTNGSGNITSNCTHSFGAVNNRCLIVVYGNVRALKHYYLSSTISSTNSVPAGDSRTVTISD